MAVTIIDHIKRKRFNLSMNEYVVVDYIGCNQDDDGICRLSVRQIAHALDLSICSVSAITNKMETKGLLLLYDKSLKATTLKWQQKR